MTDVVIPSRDRTALANAEVATNLDGPFERIIPGDERALELPEAGLKSGPLGGFDLLGVIGVDPAGISVASGEAFVGGSYVARDTETNTTASTAAPVTFAVGWEYDAADGVVIQPVGEFRDRDRFVPIWEIDSTGNAADRRPKGLAVGDNSEAGETNTLAVGPSAVGSEVSDTAVGPDAEAAGPGGTAIGAGAEALRTFAVALGINSSAGASSSAAIGTGATVSSSKTGVLGVSANGGPAGPSQWVVPGTLTVQTELTVPRRDRQDNDPPNASNGDVWYRSDLDEYRGVENGSVVSFDTTQV